MIWVKISPAARRNLERDLKAFAAKAQVGVAETVAIIGSSVAKELARKVQPFGLTEKAGHKFMISIAAQAHRAARQAEFKGIQGDLRTIHRQIRAQNKKFQVLVRPPEKFQPKRTPFEKEEKKEYVEKQMGKAGRAKAGWIAAGENIDSPLLKTIRGKIRKIKGVSRWIRRHVNPSAGSSNFVRKSGLNSTIQLTNNIDYAYASGNANRKTWREAIDEGFKNSRTIVRARLKQLK